MTRFQRNGDTVNHLMLTLLTVTACICLFASLSCSGFAAIVTTIAGSGQAGLADGPNMEATFMQPYGIAVAKNGYIFVADAAAQRIRLIDKTGIVTTVAGSGQADRSGLKVEGGYADGPARAARFNSPTGIALGTNGKIYVADSWNRCIRLIQNGTVSTYAGSPTSMGSRNGTRDEAQFTRPISIASDRHGNLFIADSETGLRKISSDGIVSTVSGAFLHPIGVAVSPQDDRYIFVADDMGLSRIGPSGKIETFARPDYHSSSEHREVQAGRQLGFPFSVVALNDTVVAFSDVRTNSVRYLDFSWAEFRILGGQLGSDPENSGGGHKDGGSSESSFDAPSGIAARADGSLLVADGGSRRIRIVSRIAERGPISTFKGLPPAEAFPKDAYNIVLLGNSIIYWKTQWQESIPAKLEETLERRPSVCQRRVRVTPIVLFDAKLDAQAEYAEVVGSTYHPKLMILVLDVASIASDIGDTPNRNNAASWQGHLQRVLHNLQRRLSAEGVRFSAVAVPFSFDLAPAETVFSNFQGSVNRDSQELLEAPIIASGVPMIDTWKDLTAEESSPEHKPLYGTKDAHLTAHGRALVASIIARHIATSLICTR